MHLHLLLLLLLLLLVVVQLLLLRLLVHLLLVHLLLLLLVVVVVVVLLLLPDALGSVVAATGTEAFTVELEGDDRRLRGESRDDTKGDAKLEHRRAGERE